MIEISNSFNICALWSTLDIKYIRYL